MAYFLGRDVKVAITTEDAAGSFSNTSGIAAIANAATPDGTNICALGDLTVGSNEISSSHVMKDVTGVDVTLGTIDEDIAYMGQRTALKAEIKKETTIALTLKKALPFFDAVFNQARYGIDSTDDSIHDGLTQPDVEFGYRVYVALNDGTEVITIPNCTMSEHTVALNADGVTEETVTFMSHVTPLIGANPNSTITGSTAL